MPAFKTSSLMMRPTKNGAIRRELNFFGRLEVDFARSNRGLQVVDHLPQISDEIDILIVGVVSETLIGTADG